MSNGSTVLDGFESYYTEKLWQLVPEVYRNEDGLATNPGVLRRIVELIAAEAAQSRRSIDRLWEDQHIETCDDWAVPYIADLVGARLVSALDRRGRRVDVANAVKFRRRRGTPDLLDTLVRAMSGWDVVLVEGFRRLARTRHRLDPIPRIGGFFTKTLSGGTADLRSPAGAELSDGPFGEYFHTLDTRLLHGLDGRFGVRKLNFHLYRLRAYRMIDVDPVELLDPDGLGLLRTYAIDPSGRDIPLFIDAEPPDPDAVAALPGLLSRPSCGQPLEWEVTQAMRCRLLGHVAYLVTASHIETLRDLANAPTAADEQALFQVLDVRFESELALRRRLQDLGAGIPANPPDWFRTLIALSLVAQTGKSSLYPSQVSISSAGVPFTTLQISVANLSSRECHPDPEGNLPLLLISPEQARFASVPPDQPVNFDPSVELYHYGFSSEVGAGPYPRDPIPAADVPSRVAADGVIPDGGVLQGDGLLIEDNRTYSLSIVSATPVESGVLQAGPQRRPYVLLSEGGANLQPQAIDSTFLIDGGWYGVHDPANPPAAGTVADFVIEGAAGADPEDFDFERVEIRFATFDPGGVRGDGIRLPALRLLVRARIRRLIIRRSIMGPIHVVRDDPDDPSVVDELIICESIVDAGETADGLAISSLFGTVVLEGSTVFGDVNVDVLKASDSIVDGHVTVVNNQAGCFRFSASEPGPTVKLPPRYRDVHEEISPATFNSTRFGDPQYGQLSVVAPTSISHGAENGSEMGVFSHLLGPIRLQSVRAKVNEFGPVGMLAQYLFEGDRQVQSLLAPGLLSPQPEPVDPPAPPDPGDIIPQPPAPDPEPLPTTCPDDEEPPERPPTLPPLPPPVLVDLTAAVPNGAPAFWRGLDWGIEALPAPSPDGEQLAGIPFDRVRYLIEYDARFGTLPGEQGWEPNTEEAAALFRLDGEGALQFQLSSQPAFFTAQVNLREDAAPQIHAYVNVLPEQIPNVAELRLDGFEQRVEFNERARPFRGMRADWVRTSDKLEFHYIALDGNVILDSPKPADSPRGNWHVLSLQGDFRQDRTLLSLDEQIQAGIKLGQFGNSPETGREASIRAIFGFRRDRGRFAGRIRNFVVSSPGRFIRAWMTARSPSVSPILRLGFVPQERVSGDARFRVRYGVTGRGNATEIPLAISDGTLRLNNAEPGKETVLEIPLAAARARDSLVMTLERDSRHAADTLEQGVRLMSAELAGR